MIFTEWYVENGNQTETKLSYEFSNKIEKNLTLDWNRILSFVRTAERNIKFIWTRHHCLGPPCCFHQVEVHYFNRPKISNNSLIRDQKSNKHMANRYKKLVRTLKREAVQFFGAKNLAVNHLPLKALPAVQTWTANCNRNRKAMVTWYFAVCGLPFPMKNLMLKVPIDRVEPQ